MTNIFSKQPFEANYHDPFFDTANMIMRSFPPNVELYFAYGSFGDHYFYASALSALLTENPDRLIKILVPRGYTNLYSSFCSHEHITLIEERQVNILAHYFRISNEWMRSSFAIKPLCPVFYPLLPSMITQQGSLSLADAIFRIIRSNSKALASQGNFDSLANTASLDYFGAAESMKKKLLFLPDSMSTDGPRTEFWDFVITNICESQQHTMVLSSKTRNLATESLRVCNVAPELLVPLASKCDLVIGSANGALHIIRCFTETRTLTVVDYSDDPYLRFKGSDALHLLELSVNSYPGYYRTKTSIFKYTPSASFSEQASQLCIEIDRLT